MKFETVPIWYGKHYLNVHLVGWSFNLGWYAHWFRDVDPSVLRCMKGIKLVNYEHICQTWQGEISNVETNTISFGVGMASVTEKYLGGCCKAKDTFDKSRDALIRRFKHKIESQPETMKKEVLLLIERLGELNGKRNQQSRLHWPF